MMQGLQHYKQVTTCPNHSEYLKMGLLNTRKQKGLSSSVNLPYFEMNSF